MYILSTVHDVRRSVSKDAILESTRTTDSADIVAVLLVVCRTTPEKKFFERPSRNLEYAAGFVAT